MIAAEARNESRLAKVGWGVLLAMSALLVLHGATWFFQGPEIALANIAESTGVAPEAFRQGNPSALEIITLITRNYSVFELAVGLFALLVAWRGYRERSRWPWMASWVLVLALAGLAIVFILAGGLGGGSVAYLVVAAVAFIGQLLAGTGMAR